MPISDVILKKGQIILTQNDSSAIGMELDNSPFLFGNVVAVSNLSDMYAVGDYVMFDATDATKFSISVTPYFMTTEDKVLTKENYTPPV